MNGTDERNQAGILTSDLSRFHLPGQARWLMEVCVPLQWRNRSRFSRDSPTPDCYDMRNFFRNNFKERDSSTVETDPCQEVFAQAKPDTRILILPPRTCRTADGPRPQRVEHEQSIGF